MEIKLKHDELLSILRNPYGRSHKLLRIARLQACDEIESLRNAYENMRDFAESQGLNTAIVFKEANHA